MRMRDISTYNLFREMAGVSVRKAADLNSFSKGILGKAVKAKNSIEMARCAMQLYQKVKTTWDKDLKQK